MSEAEKKLQEFALKNAPPSVILFPGDDDDPGREAHQDYGKKLKEFCARSGIPDPQSSLKKAMKEITG